MYGPIRYIFPLFALLMWASIAAGVATGTWTGDHWVLMALGFIACSVIFHNFVQVFSFGYAMSMMLLPAFVMARMPSPAAGLVAVACMAYGLRLWVFVAIRYRSPNYTRRPRGEGEPQGGIPAAVKAAVWLPVSTLMTFESLPVYQVARAGIIDGWVIGGTAIMLAGLVIEALADQEKQRGKGRDPAGVVMTGLYCWSRHANYLGEIIFQFGLIGVSFAGTGPWYVMAAATLAPTYIVLLMYFAARHGDEGQAARHGGQPDYAAWRARAGMLLPRLR